MQQLVNRKNRFRLLIFYDLKVTKKPLKFVLAGLFIYANVYVKIDKSSVLPVKIINRNIIFKCAYISRFITPNPSAPVMDQINIKNLALQLNLSTATVSRALRDSYEISTKTKQRVWELSKKLNYEPNPSASNLRSHKSNTIAVIVPEIANNFFSQAINGIEEIARLRNYHVLIYQTHENSGIQEDFIRTVSNGRVDGILISIAVDTTCSENFNQLISRLPIVFFDRIADNIDAVKITTDDYDSAFNATQHLIENGCKKIAYLSALNQLSTGKLRMKGYKTALENNKMTYDDQLVIEDANDPVKNLHAIKSLITVQKPDGIIASIEDLALPCYYACNLLGLNIPDDVKIISFSNINTAAILNPSLTTITQPAFKIGNEAARALFKILDKKHTEPYSTIVLKSELIARESTRARNV